MRSLIPSSTVSTTPSSRIVLENHNAIDSPRRRYHRDRFPLVRTTGLLQLAVLCVLSFPTASHAQFSVGASYGVDRNVASSQSELDGFLNITVDWISSSGLGFGIGSDHQFEGATLSPNQHLAWSLYLSPSFELPRAAVAPFVRGGIGLGRAPCSGDTCSDGVYIRGSTGIRLRVVERLRLVGEIGVSRVSRPFGGLGVSLRL